MDVLPGYITGIFAVLLLSAFAKIATVLSILRYGIGLHGVGFGAVVAGLAFALSLLVMGPQVDRLGGLDAILSGQISSESGSLERAFRPFLEKHVAAETVSRLGAAYASVEHGGVPENTGAETTGTEEPEANEVSFAVLIVAFLISELQEAFQLGFIILIPFLVVDLIVANLMLALGVSQMPQAVVALPLKILLFFAVSGWALISEKLINTYL